MMLMGVASKREACKWIVLSFDGAHRNLQIIGSGFGLRLGLGIGLGLGLRLGLLLGLGLGLG